METSNLILREDCLVFNKPLEINEIRIRLQSPNSWKNVADYLLSKVTKNEGLLRMQVGVDIKYSKKMTKNQLSEEFLKDFVDFFHFGDLHRLDEIITIAFISI